MKKYIYILFAALLFVGCSDDDEVQVDRGVVGEWRLVEWAGNTTDDFTVYLELMQDGTFHLYQRVEHIYYEHYTGTYSADKEILEGCYNDGETWSYGFAVTDEGYTLTLTDRQSNEVNVYTRTMVPSDVRTTAVTRSQTESKRIL